MSPSPPIRTGPTIGARMNDSPGNTGPVNLTDSNFQNAVNLWFDNQAEANATYGHISDWNTSAVTDMSGALRTEQASTKTLEVGIHPRLFRCITCLIMQAHSIRASDHGMYLRCGK